MSDLVRDGSIVDGRYAVKHRIGAGGMAEVYCAEDLQLGRKVALKVLYDRWAQDEEFVERFRREASSAAGLQHQNVVSIYDRGEVGDTSYIAMEYVDGRTLKTIVQQEGPLSPPRAIELTLQVLKAAHFAHKRGVIHRDFKPHNVIVDAHGSAKVTDFGIARAGASDMTQTGSIMGTAQYLSPEQAQGLPVSAQADLYSIGITLFELLTGRVPFEGDSAVAIALKQVSEAPPAPSSFNPAVSPELDAVVLRAIEKDPSRRWADAEEFAAALQAAARGLHPVASATGATAVAGGLPPLPPEDLTPQIDLGPPLPIAESYAYPPAPLVLEEDRGERRWWIPLLAGLLVAALVVGALLLFSHKQVTVPDVVGASQSQAEVTLRDEGFDTDARLKTASEQTGTVIAQSPGGRAKADKGATVRLTISSGPGEATIPDLTGQGRRAALARLGKLGFRTTERSQSDPAVGPNRVIETSPARGERLLKGQVVTVVVSTGPRRTGVPSVKGQTQAAASTALTDAGFEVTVKEEERAGTEAGRVLAQDPAAGVRRPEGSAVTITVAVAPKRVAVPDVAGLTRGQATRALSAAGFEVAVKERATDNGDEDGKVLAQSPTGGGETMPGGTVTITIGVLSAPTPTTDQPAAPATGTT